MPTDARSSRAIDALTAEYNVWNEKEGLDLGSADEHLFDPSLTEEQRFWLRDFLQRWDVERFDRRAPAVWIEGPFGHAYYVRECDVGGANVRACDTETFVNSQFLGRRLPLTAWRGIALTLEVALFTPVLAYLQSSFGYHTGARPAGVMSKIVHIGMAQLPVRPLRRKALRTYAPRSVSLLPIDATSF